MTTVMYIFLATVISGVLLLIWDFPVIKGALQACGAIEFITVKTMGMIAGAAVFVLAVFFPGKVSANTAGIIEGIPVRMLLSVGIATVASILVTSRISNYPAIPYAFIGALFGLQFAAKGAIDWALAYTNVISWICAPLACAMIAAMFYRLSAMTFRNNHVHMAFFEMRILRAAIFASPLLIGAFAWNNSILFTIFPVREFGAGPLAAGIGAASFLLARPFVAKKVTITSWNIADNTLDINSLSTLSVILAMTITFGLSPAPLSAGCLFIAALAGVSIARGSAVVEGHTVISNIVAAVLSPVLGLLIGFSMGMILNGDMINTVIVVGLLALVAGTVTYVRMQNRRLLHDQIVYAHEQQIYNTRKSLSALEVRSEMTEKDLLGKLELKRKELVDFAVGISEQKDFMETVYEQLEEVRKLGTAEEKDARTDELLSSLRERMYFTREINDFYARSEVLHKDFNMRLREAYPNLTENERKLANLLRQGFSSKYIASLMNITPKSAEINRYRLRSKLGLERSDNLIKFIKSI